MSGVSVIILVIFLFTVQVNAHIRWTYPAPRSPNDGIKSYPCGSDPFWGEGQPTTTLSPGIVTVKWEETINHNGAPFRIAISANSDDNYHKMILVDHLPHNDQGGSGKFYSFKINIPNINCPKCSLQIVNPMTDKIGNGQCCKYPANSPDYCFSVYHSCANIAITGTIPVEEYEHNYTGPCGSYTQQSATWTESDGSWWIEDNYPVINHCADFKKTCNGQQNPINVTNSNPTGENSLASTMSGNLMLLLIVMISLFI